MRIAFLFNYPLVDNTPWKQDLIRSLAERHELFVIFGKTRPQDYLKTYLRRRQEEKDGGAPAGASRPVRTTKVLTELRIPMARVANINDARCRDALSDFRPDFVVTALDQLVSRQLIAAMPIGLNAHYGILPQVKGWNATEWSLLEHGRLSVSLHRIAWPVDSGEIYLSRDVAVTASDSLGTLRAKCQSAAVGLYLRFFYEPHRYLSNAVRNDTGRTYYFMNRLLKSRLLQRIQAGEMSRG